MLTMSYSNQSISTGRCTASRVRDIDIREELYKTKLRRYCEDPQTVVVDELGIEYGAYRVDLAAINGKLYGYEIKSQTDDLTRLPKQAAAYNRVFDYVTLFVHNSHISHLNNITEINQWEIWGVAVQSTRDKLKFQRYQRGYKNKQIDLFSVASLLWKDEIIRLLETKQVLRGYKSKNRHVLAHKLVEVCTHKELCYYVRETLKNRIGWRAGQRP